MSRALTDATLRGVKPPASGLTETDRRRLPWTGLPHDGRRCRIVHLSLSRPGHW